MSRTTPSVCPQDAGVFFLKALTEHNAPRALLVSLGSDGKLSQQPIQQGQSVVNIETELLSHLSAFPHSTEWLLALRDYIDGRLAARAEAKATGGISIPRQGGSWSITHIKAFEPLTVEAAADRARQTLKGQSS